jgi:hypothetical protein
MSIAEYNEYTEIHYNFIYEFTTLFGTTFTDLCHLINRFQCYYMCDGYQFNKGGNLVNMYATRMLDV